MQMGFANKRDRRVNAAEGRSAPKPRLAEETSGEGLRQRVESLRLPPAVTVRGSAGSKLAWTLCLLLAASTGWLGYVVVEQQKKLAAGQPAAKAAPVKAALGARAAAAASSGQIVLESKGHIIPAHQILVSPKVSGMVVKLLITESQRVGRGDVLAELEDTEYRATATGPPPPSKPPSRTSPNSSAASGRRRSSKPGPNWPNRRPSWCSSRPTTAARPNSTRSA